MSYSQADVDQCNGVGVDQAWFRSTPKENRSLYKGTFSNGVANYVPCSTILANPPAPIFAPAPQPAPQQPDTQPIVPISASPAPAAGIVQPTQSLNLTDPTIIIAAILVILLGFMLSRR